MYFYKRQKKRDKTIRNNDRRYINAESMVKRNKLSGVVTDISGQSGMAMLHALINGNTNVDIKLPDEIPGIGVRSAERIIAETDVEMKQFRNADHFASWDGLVTGCNESAGKKKSSRIRKGNMHLKSTIVECAHSAIRHKESYFYAKYCKISVRRGGKRAIVTVAHSMLLAIYHILNDKSHFIDLSSNYFNIINAEKIKNRNIKSLESLGFCVQLT